jgi:hypothetical protein
MAIQKLLPRLELLSAEHVLVPAWKKAHDYIRQHNWYSDVLECDLTNADLEERLKAIAELIQSPDELRSQPLRLVLAPKSQPWEVIKSEWKPAGGAASVAVRLRPLSHVSVPDQIIATAFMLLFADAIETRQGDPRGSASDARNRKMVSYGHRLLCDIDEAELRFRWGNSIAYRQYFQDYQHFVSRPEEIVQEVFDGSTDWAIVQADLSKFYDRVRPSVLHQKIQTLFDGNADVALLAKFFTFFSWSWHPTDLNQALNYVANADPPISDFDSIALPQGVRRGELATCRLLSLRRRHADCCSAWPRFHPRVRGRDPGPRVRFPNSAA